MRIKKIGSIKIIFICVTGNCFNQSDQIIRKNHHIFGKVAQTVSKLKNPKIPASKLNLRVQNITNKQLLIIKPTTNHVLKLIFR